MNVTERIDKFFDDKTIGKNSSFLNSTWGFLFRGVRLRDLREFIVGVTSLRISYDRKVWTGFVYRNVKDFIRTQLSKIKICQPPGPKVELFQKAVDPTPEEAKDLVGPTAFAYSFSKGTTQQMKTAMIGLKAELKNDSLQFLSDQKKSGDIPNKIFEKLPDWMKKRMKDGIFHDPATGNVVALIWDGKNKMLHASFPGTGTLSDNEPLLDNGAGKRGEREQRSTDFATFLGLHIPSSHKQASDIIGACKEAVEAYRQEQKPDFKIGINCYGYCHGGSLALYAGSKNKVKTYTLVGLPLNWRMQADIGEDNMNHMVRENLVTNICVEGDRWSDPDTGPRVSKGFGKAARALETVGSLFPRPRKFGKTYRAKWKENRDAVVDQSAESYVDRRIARERRTWKGRLAYYNGKKNKSATDKRMINKFEKLLATERTREEAGALFNIRMDELKKSYREGFSSSQYIHEHPHLFINWKSSR